MLGCGRGTNRCRSNRVHSRSCRISPRDRGLWSAETSSSPSCGPARTSRRLCSRWRSGQSGKRSLMRPTHRDTSRPSAARGTDSSVPTPSARRSHRARGRRPAARRWSGASRISPGSMRAWLRRWPARGRSCSSPVRRGSARRPSSIGSSSKWSRAASVWRAGNASSSTERARRISRFSKRSAVWHATTVQVSSVKRWLGTRRRGCRSWRHSPRTPRHSGAAMARWAQCPPACCARWPTRSRSSRAAAR